jgi:tRNA A-37 threonylcarbamoyl transferase component Bud32
MKASFTELVAHDEQQQVLLLQPVGIRFAATLTDVIANEKTIPSADHFGQLVDTLYFCHTELKLVHRDLSTQNFFLREGSNVVCCSFIIIIIITTVLTVLEFRYS